MSWRWPHFTRHELACSHCGACEVDEAFMDRLELLRGTYGRPMTVTSGYRCLKYDRQIGGGGAHTTGQAIDVAVQGADAWMLAGLAQQLGFTGIGVKQLGPHNKRFLHLDTAPAPFPRPMLWSYGG